MLSSGTFKTEDNIYTVYKLTTNKFERIDIVSYGAQFHIAPEDVKYSRVTKNKTVYLFGDDELYTKYKTLINDVSSFKSPLNNTTEFSPEYKTILRTQTKEDGDIRYEMQKAGATTVHEYYRNGKVELLLKPLMKDFEIAQMPLNLGNFQRSKIDDTIVSNTGSYYPIEVLKTQYNLSHIERRDYVVATPENFDDLISRIKNYWEGIVGIDYETTGIDMWLYGEDKIVSLIVSHKKESSYYFPIAHENFPNITEEQIDTLYDTLKDIATESRIRSAQNPHQVYTGIAYDPDTNKYEFVGLGAYNNKFEHKCLMKSGRSLEILHDGLAASMVHNPRQGRGIHALKTETNNVEGLRYLEFEDIFKSMKNVNFAKVDADIARYYGCPDADNLRTVIEDRIPKSPTISLFIYHLESLLAEVKATQEYWGIKVYIDEFLKSFINVKNTHSRLEEAIRIMAKWPDLKITSNEQLAELLYVKIGCPIKLKTKMDRPSTSTLALQALAKIKHDAGKETNIDVDFKDYNGKPIIKARDINKCKYPIVLFIMKFREYEKLLSAFYARIEKSAKGALTRDENNNLVKTSDKVNVRYPFWINSFGAQTGRQSSPAHQFPKAIKKFLGPDSEDHYMIGTDYMQVELRAFFSEAGEKEFIKLASDPNNDLHRIIGSIISGKEMWEISSEERSAGKRRNFGVVYLISPHGLAVQKYGAAPTKEEVKAEEKSIADFFHAFPRAARMIHESEEKVMRDARIADKLGRYRYFDKVRDPDATRPQLNSAKRQGNNMIVQGTCAEIMKIAELELTKDIKRRGYDKLVDTPSGKFPLMRIIIPAHDEMQISVHKSIPVEIALKMKRDAMERTFEGWCPLFVESAVAYNWYDTHSGVYSIPVELRNKLIDDYERTGVSVVKDYSNIRDELLDVIKAYKQEALVTYMEDLIRVNNIKEDDYKSLAGLVRHPTLTHDLIGNYGQTQAEEQKMGKITHLENIELACKKYLKARADGFIKEETKEVKEQDKISDSEVLEEMEAFTTLTEELFDMDENGEVIYSETYDPDSEDADYFVDDEFNQLDSTIQKKTIYFWEIGDRVVIDVNMLLYDQVDELLKLIFEYNDPEGFYSISINLNDKVIDTRMRVEKLANMKNKVEEFCREKDLVNTAARREGRIR